MTRARHGRSLWRVLGIYAAASWVCLQVVDVLARNIGLPSWVFTLTLGMLIAGLPVTAVTAYLEGIGRRKKSESPASAGLFTCNNLRNGAVAALAIWGIAVTGWVIEADRAGADAERNLVTSTLYSLPPTEENSDIPLLARAAGFSLHAASVRKPHQRARLERLCRYITRPPA